MKILIALLVCLLSVHVYAETPAENLVLKKVKLDVPEKFKKFYKGDEELFLPKGFTVSVFSAGVVNPRFFAWSPSGVLHVASINNKCIYALPDADNDGVADTNLIDVGNLDKPHSLAFFKGKIYIADEREVLKFDDENGDGIFEKSEKFIEGIPGGAGHFTRTILFDTLQNYLYLSVGSSCDACRETDSLRATILRFKTDGSERKIFATGLRNAVGLALEPVTGRLWATVAERNNYSGFPEDMITSVKEGGFYGWPIAYGNRTWMNFEDTVYKKLLPVTALDSQRVATMEIADATAAAHSTPLGIHFYTGNAFPAEFKNTAFIPVHGTGADQPTLPRGYNVLRMSKDENGKWKTEDFLNGFLTSDTAYEFWGRPCGVTEDAAGNLYISSDNDYKASVHAVYKISYDPKLSAGDFKSIASVLKTSAAPNILSHQENSFALSYVLPETGLLKITLYDALGNLLKTVYDGSESPGEYKLRVTLPANIPAGMIFYKVELHGGAGFTTAVGKVIVQ